MADEKIKVLIVDDIQETRDNIQKLLQFEPDVEVVGTARTGREAIDKAGELEPEVILMDINMPDMDGITATEQIRKKITWAQIVILSVQSDPNYMRRAMLAGARDFLTKPPGIDELGDAIRRAGVMARDAKEKATISYPPPGSGPLPGIGTLAGHIVTVYSPKGGTGKTTIAVNLAVELRSEEKQVIIVDGNLQFGNVHIFLNEPVKNHVGDLTPRVDELDRELIDDVVMTHEASGLKILASPPSPEMAEDIRGDQFGKLLGMLRNFFDYVIVDAAVGLTDITLNALDMSDFVILVTSQDIPSVASCRLFLGLSAALGISASRILFVMNKYDKRINIAPDKISSTFKKEIVSIIPADDRITVPAVNRGVPFMMDSKVKSSHPIARELISLSEKINKAIEETGRR